jgi:hypothetical protein
MEIVLFGVDRLAPRTELELRDAYPRILLN